MSKNQIVFSASGKHRNVGSGRTGLQISVGKRGYGVQRCCFQPPTAIVCKTVAGAPRQGSINRTKLLSVQLNDQGDKRSSVDGYRREISSMYMCIYIYILIYIYIHISCLRLRTYLDYTRLLRL